MRLGCGTLTPTDFKLDVLYREPGLGWKRYVPFGGKNQDFPSPHPREPRPVEQPARSATRWRFRLRGRIHRLLAIQPGNVPRTGTPSARDLAKAIYTNPNQPFIKDSLYYALYDSIKAVAQQYPNLNRFVLKGSAKISSSSDISIGYNIPRGSVTVTAGGRQLIEGIDYDISLRPGYHQDHQPAIINSGIPVQVNYENNATFGFTATQFIWRCAGIIW